MNCIMMCAVGKEMKNLDLGLTEFKVNKLIMISETKFLTIANETKTKLAIKNPNLNVRIVEVNSNPWEECIRAVTDTTEIEKTAEIIVHAGVGNINYSSAMSTAAFINGLKAFSIKDGKVILLPLFKFAYFRLLTDRKLNILKLLFEAQEQEMSLETINKDTSMSLPLISYHINGNPKSEGLKKLGLITSREEKGKSYIKLSLMGRLLVQGYLPSIDQ